MNILITGSSGLVGGEAVEYFERQGHTIIGVDNNMRKEFFGEAGDTSWNLHRIFHKTKNFKHEATDIRDRPALESYVFQKHGPFDVVIHCAAQPSHDKAKEIPLIDFEVNAMGTMNLLELTRQYCPSAVFIFTSTNKVYGDAPNEIPMHEMETRFEYSMGYENGIDETCRIDQTTHSVFGASKVAADIMVQEYGRYFNMNTCVFRGGCLTGPTHSGVELHGFLSYLVKCAVTGKKYTIFGYKGKQVRDNIHSYDVIRAMEEVIKNPRPGSVYNMGGGRENSISMLEAIDFIEKFSNLKMNTEYVDQNRVGDHICYISNLTKFMLDYPDWRITKSIDTILTQLIGAAQGKAITERYVPGDGEDKYFESYAKVIVPLCSGRVIDIGCGHGHLTKLIAERAEVNEVTGTDNQKLKQKTHSKIFYWTIDSDALSETTNMGTFDTIVCTEHFEHLGYRVQDKLIEWIKLHLTNDGSFIGSMPTKDDPNNPNPFHLKTFEIDEWKEYLHKHFSTFNVEFVDASCYVWSARKPINVNGVV